MELSCSADYLADAKVIKFSFLSTKLLLLRLVIRKQLTQLMNEFSKE